MFKDNFELNDFHFVGTNSTEISAHPGKQAQSPAFVWYSAQYMQQPSYTATESYTHCAAQFCTSQIHKPVSGNSKNQTGICSLKSLV